MAGKPKNFQAISPVLANYDFVDIVAGTGFINFYAGKTVDKNMLSNKEFYSDTVYTQGSSTYSATAVYTKVLDIDFDVLLNRPLDLKGVGIVNVPVKLTETASPCTVYAYVIATLRKWDGATETDIVTNTSSIFADDADLDFQMLAIDLDVPLTHFKIGEYLRLTIELWSYNTANIGTQTAGFGHDPKGRSAEFDTTGAVTSQLSFQCPVRLNL